MIGAAAVLLLGCGALINKLYGIDATKYRTKSPNPVADGSGKPLEVGFEQKPSTNCDHPIVQDGIRVTATEQQLCFSQREIFSTTPSQPMPRSKDGFDLKLKTDTGETTEFHPKPADPKMIGRCVGDHGEFIMWASISEACVPNNNVLTKDSKWLDVSDARNDRGSGGWSFESGSTSASNK